MKRVLWVVDAQKDFMNADGALSVPGAEQIKPILRQVLLAAQRFDVDIFGSMDAHEATDDEMVTYPPHCLVNTEGQKLVPECIVSHPDNIYIIPNNGNGIDMTVFQGATEIFFEKQTTDIWNMCLSQPDNIQTLFRMMDVTDVYAVGAIGVIDAVSGFIERKYNVHVIEDAVCGLDIPENGTYPTTAEKAIAEMKESGARIITLADFICEIEE